MNPGKGNGLSPRPLRRTERELLESVLPADRSGYREYRDLIRAMIVLGEGRRGKGNFVLGFEGDTADVTSPLPPVIAFGMIETTQGSFSITVRQYAGKQIDVELVSDRGDDVPDVFEEKRRWTLSSWIPGQHSPQGGSVVREVEVTTYITLAFSTVDRRMWVHDHRSGMNHPLPVTTFHGELMVHKNLRDPKTVLKPDRFFDELEKYSDSDLREAFITYNSLRPRFTIERSNAEKKGSAFGMGLTKFFARGWSGG